MMIIDWYEITANALINLWQGFIGFIPQLVGAIIILIIGWFVSVGVGKLIAEILKRIKFNRIFEKGSWRGALEKAEIKIDASSFIGVIFKWVLFIVFLMAAVDVLGFQQFANFLVRVLGFLPNVIVAALIFIVAVIVADIVEKVVRAAVESAKVGYGQVVGAIVRWSIWIFAILAILMQLGVASALIQTLLNGFVALIVISAGLAFGLGGKEIAGEVLQDIKRKLRE